MKLSEINTDEIIYFRKNKKYKNIYDILLTNNEQIRKLDSFEAHFVLYPFDRKISSEEFKFNPFEEYVKDIISEHRSVYVPIADNSKRMFGFFLGLIITIAFAVFRPEILISVESIVSIFAAYTFGKEFWDDLQKGLVRMSKNWKFSYIENYYLYNIERKTTLTKYSNLARKMRLDFTAVLPSKFDFIWQSNSQTLRLKFYASDFENIPKDRTHLFSIQIKDDAMVQDFEQSGFLFGIKLSFNKFALGFKKSYEVFQSLKSSEFGCLSNENEWINDAVFFRKTISFKRLKYFKQKGLLANKKIIKKNF